MDEGSENLRAGSSGLRIHDAAEQVKAQWLWSVAGFKDCTRHGWILVLVPHVMKHPECRRNQKLITLQIQRTELAPLLQSSLASASSSASVLIPACNWNPYPEIPALSANYSTMKTRPIKSHQRNTRARELEWSLIHAHSIAKEGSSTLRFIASPLEIQWVPACRSLTIPRLQQVWRIFRSGGSEVMTVWWIFKFGVSVH